MPSIARRVAETPFSGIRRFFDIIATMKDAISLGVGQPDFVTPEIVLRAGVDSLLAGNTGYTSNSGRIELRRAVSKHISRLYGQEYDPEQEILITVGASEGIYLALTAILNPGDEVIIPEPCFVAYKPEVVFAGGKPIVVETKVETGFQLQAEDVEALITPRTKAILINYPNNPTGAVMSWENIEKLADLARKHDLFIISDECYDRLVYDWQHIMVSSVSDLRERTIVLYSLSKDYAMTGWRIAAAMGPHYVINEMLKVHQYTIMSAPTPAQFAAETALTIEGDIAVHAMVGEYDRRRRFLVKALNDVGLDCHEPHGTFYVFPSIKRSGMTSEQFAEALLQEEKVAMVPGNVFGACGEGYLRGTFATSMENLEEALRRIGHFMQRHQAN